MELISCNLCGSEQSTPLIDGRDRLFYLGGEFHVVECADCGLAYVNPRPDASEIGMYYPLEYQELVRGDYIRSATSKRSLHIAKQGIDLILRRRIPPWVEGGRALEIGCAQGNYLRTLQNLGWKAHGVELAPEQAQYAREQFGLNVLTGDAETALPELPSDHFDVVALWHVLEHLFDPSRTLAEIHRVLKPGGRLMLEVPNLRSLSKALFRSYWLPLELPRHLYHFTPSTLEAALTKAGFSQINIEGVPAALALTMTLQLLWNRLTGPHQGIRPRRKGTRLIFNPALLGLAFPASWLLARFRLSSHMSAQALKPA